MNTNHRDTVANLAAPRWRVYLSDRQHPDRLLVCDYHETDGESAIAAAQNMALGYAGAIGGHASGPSVVDSYGDVVAEYHVELHDPAHPDRVDEATVAHAYELPAGEL